MNSARMYRLMLPVRRPVDRYVWLNEALVKGLSSQDYTSYVRYDSTLLMFQQEPRSKALKASNCWYFRGDLSAFEQLSDRKAALL